MAETPHVLIVSGTAPGEPGVGGVILRDLIRRVPEFTFSSCWLAPRGSAPLPQPTFVPIEKLERRYEAAYRPMKGIVGEIISAGSRSVLRSKLVRQFADQIVKHVEQTGADRMLAVLESPIAIDVLRQLADRVKLPISTIVWDDIEVFAHQYNLDRYSKQALDQSFGEVLRRSDRVAVICEGMRDAYRQRYGVDSFVLRHGMDAPDLPPRLPAKDLIIGYAGSITAPDCVRSLVAGLDHIGWSVNGRDVVLRLLGSRYLLDSRQKQRIEYFGWRGPEETLALLADCTLCYLPQTFNPAQKYFSQLSFPTKLSTYVATGQPVLLHAPDHASVSLFMKEYAFGPICASLDPTAVAKTLQQSLSADANTIAGWQDELRRAHKEALSVEQFEANSRRLLGVEALEPAGAR